MKFTEEEPPLINTLKTLASALVQCHFDYACTSRFTSSPKHLNNKLQTSHNKLVRIVLKLPPHTHLEVEYFVVYLCNVSVSTVEVGSFTYTLANYI